MRHLLWACILSILVVGMSRGISHGDGTIVKRGASEIPAQILRIAEEHVISRMGAAMLVNHFKFDADQSAYIIPDTTGYGVNGLLTPHYSIHYEFCVPGLDSITVPVWFCIDESGEVVGLDQGMPDCVADSTECVFNIDESAAIAIAQANGLAPGLRGFEARFSWSRENGYVWSVQNLLKRDERAREEGGKLIVIDAFSGELVKELGWTGHWD